jgi:hypothetical protein
VGLHGRHSWPRLESDEVCWVCLLIPICDDAARNKDGSTSSFSTCRTSGNCDRQRVVLWPTARAQHREIATDRAKACDIQLQNPTCDAVCLSRKRARLCSAAAQVNGTSNASKCYTTTTTMLLLLLYIVTYWGIRRVSAMPLTRWPNWTCKLTWCSAGHRSSRSAARLLAPTSWAARWCFGPCKSRASFDLGRSKFTDLSPMRTSLDCLG